jgi:DNA-binding response OmpR family regulator
MKIVLVEDTPESAQLFIRILTVAGHEVLHTPSGLEGMRLARKEHPDILLLDFSLPDLDGSQICLALHQQLRDIGMIAITAHSDRVTRRKAELFGFDAFVAKPISIDELLGAIQTQPSRHHLDAAQPKFTLRCNFSLSGAQPVE